MRTLRFSQTARIGLLALTLIVTGAALCSSPSSTAFAQTCCGHATSVTYYSDASHTTVVGHCVFPCYDDPVCTGTQTPFSTTKQLQCCIC